MPVYRVTGKKTIEFQVNAYDKEEAKKKVKQITRGQGTSQIEPEHYETNGVEIIAYPNTEIEETRLICERCGEIMEENQSANCKEICIDCEEDIIRED